MQRPVKIGLTVLAGLLGLYVFISWATSSGLFGLNRREITIRFRHVSGLKRHDAVNVRGINVGRVETLQLGKEGVLVTASLNQNVPLSQDARAEILVSELMGGKHIRLYPGQSEDPLPQGSKIPGRTAFDIQAAAKSAGEVFEEIDSRAVVKMIENLDTLANEIKTFTRAVRPNQLSSTMSELQKTLRMINLQMAEVKFSELANNLERTSATVEGLATETEKLLPLVDTTLRASHKRLPRVDSTLEELNETMRLTQSTLQTLRPAVLGLTDSTTLAGQAIASDSLARRMESVLSELEATAALIQSGNLRIRVGVGKNRKE